MDKQDNVVIKSLGVTYKELYDILDKRTFKEFIEIWYYIGWVMPFKENIRFNEYFGNINLKKERERREKLSEIERNKGKQVFDRLMEERKK